MTVKKFLALVLAALMLMSLAACGGDHDPTDSPTTQSTTAPTSQPTTEPTTVPTEPESTPAELYAQAVDKLNSATQVELTVETERTVTISGESYTESSEQTISYSGYGTETMTAAMQETADIDGYITTYDEIFMDGTMYTTIDDTYCFKGSMTAGEYTSRFVPVVMLDAALYGEITQGVSSIRFSSPTAGESWIVPEYAQLVDASGTALLSSENELVESYYNVTYAIGGAQVTYEISVQIDAQAELTIEAPAASDYIELEYVDAPRLMEQAAGYLSQTGNGHSLTASITESVTSYAGGIIRNQVSSIDTWGSGSDYMANYDVSVFAMDAYGEYNYEQEEHFRDGVYTYSADGSEPEANASVTRSVFQNYVVQALSGNLPGMDYLAGASATDLGSLYYIELTFTEELALALEDNICSSFWEDEDFLDDLADSYRTGAMTGYLAIDKNTGLPTAMGYFYEGYHRIDDTEWMLSLQNDQSYDLASMSAYETLAEAPPVPEEPEEKATPLFYHVTGADGQEMWLLGTIHIGDARTSYLPQEIYDAFDAADALAVEFNSEAFDKELEENEELSDQISGAYFYGDGSTTQDHVDSELFEYAEILMKATGNYHMNAPYLKAYFWGSSIDNFYMRQSYDLSSTQGVDNQLIHRAMAAGKTILDVESGLFQIQMLSGFSDGLQELLLAQSVSTDPYASVEATRELFEMWCAGDEAALTEYITDDGDTSDLTDEELALVEEYNNAMGTDRNDDMLDVAIGYLESGDVVFYAVGLAHLLAEDGLVNTLRDAGYTVELVSYE